MDRELSQLNVVSHLISPIFTMRKAVQQRRPHVFSSHDPGKETLTTKRHRTNKKNQHHTVTVGRDLWVSTSLQSLEECLMWMSLYYCHISVSDCSVIRAKFTTNPLDDQMPPIPGESHCDRAKRLASSIVPSAT